VTRRNVCQCVHEATDGFVDLGVVARRQRVHPVQTPQQTRDARLRERCGQRGGGPAFALVRFVENRKIVGRQERPTHREIEKEERVVDDHEIGELGLVASREEVAIAKALAELADAVVGVRVELLPFGGRRRKR
jgi:hypothetical protein